MIRLDVLQLPHDLHWSDEFAWSEVAASVAYSVQGTPQIEMGAVARGKTRPLTLSGQVWISRADLKTLFEWTADPDWRSLITLHDGRRFTVMFRHWDKPVIEATPVKDGLADAGDEDMYELRTLKMVIV